MCARARVCTQESDCSYNYLLISREEKTGRVCRVGDPAVLGGCLSPAPPPHTLCVCVCVCVRACVCISMYIYTFMYVCMYVCLGVHKIINKRSRSTIILMRCVEYQYTRKGRSSWGWRRGARGGRGERERERERERGRTCLCMLRGGADRVGEEL